MQIYQDTDEGTISDSLDEFVSSRLFIRKGGYIFKDPILEYPWQVSNDEGTTFREPTSNERAEFDESVWATRELVTIGCAENCYNRFQRDSIWRCDCCYSIWLSETSRKCLGRDMTADNAHDRVSQIVRNLNSGPGLPIAWRPDYVEFEHEVEFQATEFINGFFLRRSNLDLYDSAIIDIDQQGYESIHFCVVSRDLDGELWVNWEAATR